MPVTGAFLHRSRHGTVYYFRRRVPPDLWIVVGCRTIYRSLGTTDRHPATVRARQYAVTTDALFERLRAMTNKKTKDDPLSIGMMVSLKFERPDGSRMEINVDADPEIPADLDAAKATIAHAAQAFSLSSAIPAVPVTTSANSQQRLTVPLLPLGAAIDRFLREADLKDSTLAAYRTALRSVALKHFGADADLLAIEQRDFAKFVGWVGTLPRTRNTQDGYVVALSALGTWYRKRGEKIPEWSSASLLPRSTSSWTSTARPPLTIEQIRAMFVNAAKYRAAEPGKFWVTAMAAFTGCRLAELCQLDLTNDLKSIETPAGRIHYLDVNEQPDADGVQRKSVKTAASCRLVPLHSALVRHGVVDYLRERSTAGLGRPFESIWKPLHPELSRVPDWGHYVGRWGLGEMKRLERSGGFVRTDGQSYFHSLRHSFVTHLATKRVDEELRAILAGHTFGGVNARVYTHLRENVADLAAIVEQNFAEYEAALDEALTK